MSTAVINEDIASLMGELAGPAGQADPYPSTGACTPWARRWTRRTARSW